MFKKNDSHLQQKMFTVVDQLPVEARKRLEESWAFSFYQDFFCKLDETLFSQLYSKSKSRPNTPINIMVGFETLKSGFGWSDEELYSHFLFDLQVRYALGLHDFDENYFDLRTIYNFRKLLVNHENEHGENLIKTAVDKITDKQLEKFKIKTGLQRMDSTQIQSNIRNMSRIQLLVEIIHRIYRELSEVEKEQYKDRFDTYIKQNALHYCYKLKKNDAETKLFEIGKDLDFFIIEFEQYQGTSAYKNMCRVFKEHYKIIDDKIEAKKGKELNSSTLQSPDDIEATFRKKNGKKAKGYVANITETCDSDNKLQLITKVSVDKNIVDDQKLMSDDLKNIAERMKIEEIVTDAGYTGELANKTIKKHEIKQKTTAIKGRKKKKDKLALDDFKIIMHENGELKNLECPKGKKSEIKKGQNDRYTAGFKSSDCEQCPFREICPVNKLKKKPLFVYRFSLKNIEVALKRQALSKNKDAINIRASVESTVRSLIHPFGGNLCKMPVRGKPRITHMAVLGGAMINIRRISNYLNSIVENEEINLIEA